ncbi:MAG: glycerol-3-phosphate 1-O-acyltransferase PlsY [Burkholderiales bacterium]|nr:glycerol-3-phosphate 1-O-acyltransferase PlsY [Burkholderiales bacterium]
MLKIAVILLSYLAGSVSFALISSRLFKLPDPRTYGSGNPGATNVLRTGKKAAAALTLIGDGAKGTVAVLIAQHYFQAPAVIAASALAVFLGHLFPVFLGFKGGKGVATALGICFALDFWLGAAVAGTWLIVFFISRISSLSALAAAGLAPLYAFFILGSNILTLGVFAMCLLLIWRHKTNIAKLLKGEEGAFKG